MRASLRAKRFAVAVVLGSSAVVAATAVPAGAAAPAPTCSETLPIAVHGQHIVGDYVTGIGNADLDWPPKGGVVGAAVQANGGGALAGGPGPGFHFPSGVAPGASFCTGSKSPGAHL